MRCLWLPLLAACGLAPNDDLTGARIAEGISPWEDQGAIQLCLGNDRIGPAGSPAGGFCVDVNIPNEVACTRDSDCASRELCACGLCTVKYCNANGECPAGHACSFSDKRCLPSCHQTSECKGANEICSGGLCKGRCGASSDCQYGEVCGSSNRCVVAACGTPADCRAGEICKVQRVPRATAEPSVIAGADPTVFTMYLEMANLSGLRRQLWRALSGDGVHFQLEPAQPIVADGGAPAILRLADGTFRLYYETPAGITSTDSLDGRAFGPPALVIPGDFHAPTAVLTPVGPLLYVQVGARQGIAVWNGSGAPQTVLTPAQVSDPVLFRDVVRVGSPSALVEDTPLGEPVLRLWFDAFGKESATSIQFGNVVELPPNDSIAEAQTLRSDPLHLAVWPFNPVFDRIIAFLQHRAELQPSVVRVPGRQVYYLYYVGRSADGSENDGIGVARNPPLRGTK